MTRPGQEPTHAATLPGGSMRIRGKLIASYSLLVLLILLAFAFIVYTTFAEYIKQDRDGYFNMKGKSVFQKLTSAVNGHMQEMELFRVRSGLERFAANRTTAGNEDLTKKLALFLVNLPLRHLLEELRDLVFFQGWIR